jgi:CO/xanthine dehydrogenase FAD-binding subunit
MPFSIQALEHYYKPTSIEDACSILYTKEATIPIAGGSAIYIFSSKGLLQDVRGFVDIFGLGLNSMLNKGRELVFGSTLTHQELLESATVTPKIIRESVLTIPKEVRSVGTVGGQISTCFPNFDLNVALLALDATVTITDGHNERTEGIQDFFRGVFSPDLKPGEIVLRVTVPSEPGAVTGYAKSTLTSHGFSVMSLGVSLKVNNGFFEGVRLAVGGTINSAPTRLRGAEAKLEGQPCVSESITRASEEALHDGSLNVVSDFKTSDNYKRRLVSALLRRTVSRLVGLT